jgi:hypothetical protein
MKRTLAVLAVVVAALFVAVPPAATTQSLADGLPRCCV